MKTPHKHAELIKAWADGAEIQMRTAAGNWCSNSQPGWSPQLEYRIKPEPKPDVVWLGWMPLLPRGTHWQQLVYGKDTGDANVKAVYDGETGKLKSISLINKD